MQSNSASVLFTNPSTFILAILIALWINRLKFGYIVTITKENAWDTPIYLKKLPKRHRSVSGFRGKNVDNGNIPLKIRRQ